MPAPLPPGVHVILDFDANLATRAFVLQDGSLAPTIEQAPIDPRGWRAYPVEATAPEKAQE